MANNEQNKTIGISTIPIGKLAVVMNNFISNTINHLNKLSVKGDEKLAEFDKKLDDLEIMTTLLEAKLNSLPEKITSTYPPLEDCELDDVTPVNNPIQEQPYIPPPPPPPDVENQNQQDNAGYPDLDQNPSNNLDANQDKIVENTGNAEGGDNLSPAEDLEKFLKENEQFRNLYKMLKLGVPVAGVEQKAKMNGINMDKLHELIEKVHKVDPNIG
jgi:hypothetical protein